MLYTLIIVPSVVSSSSTAAIGGRSTHSLVDTGITHTRSIEVIKHYYPVIATAGSIEYVRTTASKNMVSHQRLCKLTLFITLKLIITILYTACSDLLHVVRLIRQFTDWRSLGLELGLRYRTLQDIQQKNPGENSKQASAACQMDMLKCWLDGEDDVTQCGGPTWQQLANSLKRLEQDSLARDIEQLYTH